MKRELVHTDYGYVYTRNDSVFSKSFMAVIATMSFRKQLSTLAVQS